MQLELISMSSPEQRLPAPPQLYPPSTSYPTSDERAMQARTFPPMHPGYQDGHQAQGYPQPYMAQPIVNVTVSPTMQQSFAVHGHRPVRHGLHFVLTLLTGGLWLFVWIPLARRRRH